MASSYLISFVLWPNWGGHSIIVKWMWENWAGAFHQQRLKQKIRAIYSEEVEICWSNVGWQNKIGKWARQIFVFALQLQIHICSHRGRRGEKSRITYFQFHRQYQIVGTICISLTVDNTQWMNGFYSLVTWERFFTKNWKVLNHIFLVGRTDGHK